MKKLLYILLAAFAMMIAVPSTAQDTDLTPEQSVLVVQKMSEQLPMDMGNGMTWTAITLADNMSVVEFYWLLDENKIEESAELMKTGFSQMTDEQAKEFIGEDFVNVLKMLHKNGRVIIKFTDGKTYTFNIKP